MPFERTDPAAWWRGAEPLPPKPDAPGEWEPVATAYGWEWRLAEEPGTLPSLGAVSAAVVVQVSASHQAVSLCVRPEPAPWQVRPPTFPPEVRVGDRLHHRYGEKPWIVREVAHGFARVECDGVEVSAGLHNIGLDGHLKLWTLLPRETEATTPAADTAGILREGHRILDRLARGFPDPLPAGAPVPAPVPMPRYVMPDGRLSADPAGSIGIAGSAGPHGPDAAFWERARVACDVHKRSGPSRGSLGAMAAALRAADAVPDPRREALERVARAARDATTPSPGGLGEAYVRLCGVLRALAALDGERGPP